MRVNLKKIIGFALGFAVIWIILSYLGSFEVRRGSRRDNIQEVETKIINLEKQMQLQFIESNKLLELAKKQLYKSEALAKEKEKEIGDDNDIHDVEEGLQLQDAKITTPVLPVLVMACDRVTVKRCLDNIVKFRPNKLTFPIIVSQDCGHNATYNVIKSFTESDPSITIIKQPDLSEIPLARPQVVYRGYYKISRHYKFALNYVFMKMNYDAVIIVEDDLDISPDFFEYFLGTYPLLLKDPSLWCISAWNDNGKKELIDLRSPWRLYRTDFFPGLGWLLRKEMWTHVAPTWPPAFFDDWLRDPSNTQHRACIRPEISRTYSFGKIGVSKGLYFENHLRYMQLNMEFVEFTKLNLTYLLKPIYDEDFKKAAYSSIVWSAQDVVARQEAFGEPANHSVRVVYSDAPSFRKAAKKLGLMDDLRSGIPRTAYLGIVSCYIRGRRVYLTPNFKWVKYDPKWS